MPSCSLCPGRFFKDQQAVQMHTESKHTYTCEKCDKVLHSEQALGQHITDKHFAFECRYCDREFATENGRLSHEQAKHPSMFECEYCDREFTTDEGRLAHQKAKHAFKCHYCDREFSSEDARQQHEDAKHQMFECHHCDREFTTESGRDAHEEAKHSAFECNHCDRTFTTEQGRDAHEEAKHPTFECQFCDSEFASEEACRQHEDASHKKQISCLHCGRLFVSQAARLQHEQAMHHSKWAALPQTPHIQCGYCSSKFLTQGAKHEHEQLCGFNPANRVTWPFTLASPNRPFLRSDSPPSNKPDLMDIDEVLSTFAVTKCTGEEQEPAISPSASSHSAMDQDMLQSTSNISSTDTTDAGEGSTAERPCGCAYPLEVGACTSCQPVSSLSSSMSRSNVLGDTGNLDSTADGQSDSMGHRDIIFPCTYCLAVLGTAGALRDHACAPRTSMLRPHCTICYDQFEDGTSLQKHLEGPKFTCQLCLIRCCSEEMMQDHLFSHPTCSKCGKSFADNFGLSVHVTSDHPIVVCWDCDGIVVESNDLESHYTDSPAHPSCLFCGVGKQNLADMKEHVNRVHATGTEIEVHTNNGVLNVGAGPCEVSLPLAEQGPTAPQQMPQPTIAEADPLDASDQLDGDSPHKESTPDASPQPPTPSEAEHVREAATTPCSDEVVRQYTSPSPTPSEHGSNTLHTSLMTNNDTRTPSSGSSVSSLSDTSADNSRNTSTVASDSSHSLVLVSADAIPDFVKDNRAILVATSAGLSGQTPLRPSSSSSHSESLDVPGPGRGGGGERADAVVGAKYRLHCRICLLDPCETMTATMCGHLFCKRCITQALVAKSECPVCQSATLLYCLFKLDLSV